MRVKIGLSVNSLYAPMGAFRIWNALAHHFTGKNQDSEVEFFQEGVDYIKNGIENAHIKEHEEKIKKLVDLYFEHYDGLAIPGNLLNINNKFYSGVSGDLASIDLNCDENRRTKLEIALVHGALNRGIPIIGICGGNQVINVALGGKIKTVSDNIFDNDKKEDVIYLRDTQLHGIVQTAGEKENQDILSDLVFSETSLHHQAIDPESLPYVLLKAAQDKDGIIKAVEIKGHHPWVLGIQFHPEYDFKLGEKGEEQNVALFKDFLDACRVVKEHKERKQETLKYIKAGGKNLRAIKVNNKDSHFYMLVKKFADDLKKNKFEDINIQTLKDETKSISALIYVFQQIEPNDRVKFARTCEDLIKQSSTLQVIKLFEYIPANEREPFFKEKIRNENQLISTFNYLSEVNKFLLVDSLKTSLGLSFTKLIELTASTSNKEEINDCSRVGRIFKILPEDIRQEFIKNNIDEISKIIEKHSNFIKLLESFPENNRLEFANTFKVKITNTDELSNVAQTLAKNDRVNFVLTFENMIKDGEGLSDIVNVLDDVDKVKFAKKFENRINDGGELCLVIEALADKDKVSFANDHQDKILGINGVCQVLGVLENEHKIKFANGHQDKIKTIQDLTKIIKVLGSDELNLDKVNSMITNGTQLITFLKEFNRDRRLVYAIKLIDRISNEKELSDLQNIFKLSRDKLKIKKEFSRKRIEVVHETTMQEDYSSILFHGNTHTTDTKSQPSQGSEANDLESKTPIFKG